MQSSNLRGPAGLVALLIIGNLAAAGLGCGGVASGPYPDAPPPTIDAAPDAPAVVPRCDPAKPFGTPTLVAGINSASLDQGAKLVDELTLYFGSQRTPAGLYKATRSTPTSPFGAPVALTAFTATGIATGPTFTGNGLTMYYALVATGQTTGDLYVTTRASKSVEFAPGTLVAQVNSTVEDLDPFITDNDAALYFDSSRGTTALHLYVASRQPDGMFGAPQALTNLNTTAVDGHPVLSQDGLTLYWSSTRADGGALGVTDIWSATRPSTAATFGAATRVPELSSDRGESVSWIAADGCVAYLQSDRAGGLGGQDIYEARRPM